MNKDRATVTKGGREAKTGNKTVLPQEDSEVQRERISEGKVGTVSYGSVNTSGGAFGTQAG